MGTVLMKTNSTYETNDNGTAVAVAATAAAASSEIQSSSNIQFSNQVWPAGWTQPSMTEAPVVDPPVVGRLMPPGRPRQTAAGIRIPYYVSGVAPLSLPEGSVKAVYTVFIATSALMYLALGSDLMSDLAGRPRLPRPRLSWLTPSALRTGRSLARALSSTTGSVSHLCDAIAFLIYIGCDP